MEEFHFQGKLNTLFLFLKFPFRGLYCITGWSLSSGSVNKNLPPFSHVKCIAEWIWTEMVFTTAKFTYSWPL